MKFPSSPENGAHSLVAVQGSERGNFRVVPLRRGSPQLGLSQDRRNTRRQVQVQGEGRASHQHSYTGENNKFIFIKKSKLILKTFLRLM